MPAFEPHTFFFTAVEWLYDTFPEPLPQTVPTQAMRNGDFSALLAQGTIIYDPATATQVGAPRRPAAVSRATSFRRTASARSRPQLLKYFPLPNQAADNRGGTTSSTSIPAATRSIRCRRASITG